MSLVADVRARARLLYWFLVGVWLVSRRRFGRRVWSTRFRRLVASVSFLLLVISVSTQSATAAQLTPGKLPLGALTRWFDDLTASTSSAPQQQSGHGARSASTKADRGTGHAPGVGVGQAAAATLSDAARVAGGTSAKAPQGFDAKTSKWLPSKSTEKTSWWSNADGSETERISGATVNYRTASGGYEPIDASLVASITGDWRQKANGFGLTISAHGGGVSSTSELASLSYGSEQTFGWGLSGASGVAGELSGATVTYPAILPGTDLSLTSEDWGVKETLRLDAASAASSWVFPLDETGLTLGQGSGGVWELEDSGGVVVAAFSAPYATDAAGSRTDAVTYSLTSVGGVQELVMKLDPTWLSASGRAFPVIVDPTVTVSNPGTENSAYISALNPSTNSNSDSATSQILGVGYPSNGDTQVSYINFPTGVADDGYHITAASLTMFQTKGPTAATDPFTVDSVASPWSPSTIAWGEGAPTSYISQLGTYAGQVVTAGPCSGNSGSWVGTTLDPAAMSQFSANVYSWNGVMILPGNNTSSAYYRQFSSTQVASCSPYLSLTYTADVAPTLAASSMSPASGTAVSTLTQQLTASGSDADNWPNSSVQYEFFVYSVNSPSTDTADDPATDNGGGGGEIAKSGLLSTGSWTVPKGVLKWGQTYAWEVCVWDGWECQSSTLTANTFSTTAPGPMLTEDLSQSTDGHGFNAQNGDYTTSATDADVAGLGPALSIVRDYNSLNDAKTGAFGAGWSSILDAHVTQGLDTTGKLMEAAVTYPDGSLVAFGLNSDGTYSPPEGRYATLTPTTSGSAVTGYTLVDKTGTTYVFGHVTTTASLNNGSSSVPGVFGLTEIKDREGRELDFNWSTATYTRQVKVTATFTATQSATFTEIGTITNPLTGRALVLNWVWPNISTMTTFGNALLYQRESSPHVASVTVTSGSTAEQVWGYTYSADDLSTVCAPSQSQPLTPDPSCTAYFYSEGSVYREAVLDSAPYQYWPLSDVGNTGASNSSPSLVGANVGSGSASYQNLAPDSASPANPATRIGSSAASALFNGSSSFVYLPPGMVTNTTYVSVGLWFKTTGSGPLFCEQSFAITASSGNATCSLYVGTDGLLRGEWYQGARTPITSSSAVNDGAWHYVLLSGEGSKQSMYLDGQLVGSLPGTITNLAQTYDYAGAGYSSGAWPGTPSATGNWYFTGSMADLAVYKQGVPAAEVASLYQSATDPAAELNTVYRPDHATDATKSPAAQVAYDTVSWRVSSVTDANGATWRLGSPSSTGSGQVFRETVMGLGPSHYYRLEDGVTTTPADEVNPDAWYDPQNTATASSVTFGSSAGSSVFDDGTDAASFAATAQSSLVLPQGAGENAPVSIGLWFNAAGAGPLYCMQNAALPTAASASTCPLYIGTNGKLYGGYYLGSVGTGSNIESAHTVTGSWHYAVLTTTATSESLYLDGALVGTKTGAFNANGQALGYIGAGYSSGDWPSTAAKGNWYYTGAISDVALFPSALTQDQVTSLWQGYKNTVGSVVPLETVTVSDPSNTLDLSDQSTAGTQRTETYAYDPAHGGRETSYTDGLGGRTTYGYDVNGFQDTVTDPNGDATIIGHDPRGDVVSRTTCQNQTQNKCQTSYATYYWAVKGLLSNTANPDADLEMTSSDGRSSSAVEATYQSTYTYDDAGNKLTSQDPDGNTTTNVYTDGTMSFPACSIPTGDPTGASSSTLYEPKGLLAKTKTEGNAITQYSYYPDGDTCKVVDADGLETLFAYDVLGRITTKIVTGASAMPLGVTGYGGTLKTTYLYDGDGRVSQTTAPAVTDRVTGFAHTAVTTQKFDADGNVTSTTVADSTGGDYSRETTYTYDSYDRVASRTAPEGNPSDNKATPGDSGTQAANADGHNHVTSYTYDAFGNVNEVTDPQNRTTEYLYNADDEVVSTRLLNTELDGTASTTGHYLEIDNRAYDAGGRLAEEHGATQNAAPSATCYLYYDDNLPYEAVKIDTSRLTACPASSTDVTTDDGNGSAFIAAIECYDGAGNLIQSTTNDQQTVTLYSYDDDGRQLSSTLDPNGFDRVSTNTYFADGYIKESKLTAPGATGTPMSDVTYTYTPMGEMLTTNVADDSSNLTTTDVRDERGLAVQSTDPDGNTTIDTYDEAGRLVITQSPRVTATTYSITTMSASQTTAFAIVTNGYDTFGDLVESEGADSPNAGQPGTVGAAADSTVYTYDADGNQTSATLPVNTAPGASASTTVVSYDGDGEPIESLDPVAYNSYLASGKTSFTAGLVTTETYNQFGELQKSTSTDYTNPASPVPAATQYTYYANGAINTSIDPTLAANSKTYDYLGNVLTATQTERHPTDNTSGTANYTTDYSYGVGGWLSQVSSPDLVGQAGGTSVSYSYYPTGETKQVTYGQDDYWEKYAYDGAGRVVKTTQPDGSYATATYDEAGRNTEVAAYNASDVAQSWEQNLYGNDNELLCTEKPLPGTTVANLPAAPASTGSGAITAANYASTCTASTSYDLTQYRYDAAGRLTSETQPVDATSADAITVAYGYDLAGNQTAYTPGDGNTAYSPSLITAGTTYATYNAWQLPQTTIEPATSAHSSAGDRDSTASYDADGRAYQVSQPGGVTVNNSYDGFGNVSSQSGAGATGTTAQRTFSYDLDGRVTNAATSNTLTGSSSNATNETLTYDDRGDLIGTSGSAGTSSFKYNGDGLMTSAGNTVSSTTQTTTYGYDTEDRLQTLNDAATGTTLTYGYSPTTATDTVNYGSGGDVRTLKMDSDTLGHLSSDTLAAAGGPTVQALSYTWDVDGNLVEKNDAAGNANSYTYDQADRLTSWTEAATSQVIGGVCTTVGGTTTCTPLQCSSTSTLTCYSYDKDSNRTEVGSNIYTYDARDELTSDGINTYAYTANGNLQTKTTDSGATTYTDDAYGQQTAVGVAGYTYDAGGRLVSEQNAGTTTASLTYQGVGNQVASDGTDSYTRDPAGNLIGAATPAGARLLWTDLHTDVVATFTATSTSLTGTHTYDPLGNTQADTGNTTNLSVGYQSEWTDTQTGEVNMASRWYNPATGQFLNKDTVSNSATPNVANANPFGYANGNPLNGIDPTGHFKFSEDDAASPTDAAMLEAMESGATGANRRLRYVAILQQQMADINREKMALLSDMFGQISAWNGKITPAPGISSASQSAAIRAATNQQLQPWPDPTPGEAPNTGLHGPKFSFKDLAKTLLEQGAIYLATLACSALMEGTPAEALCGDEAMSAEEEADLASSAAKDIVDNPADLVPGTDLTGEQFAADGKQLSSIDDTAAADEAQIEAETKPAASSDPEPDPAPPSSSTKEPVSKPRSGSQAQAAKAQAVEPTPADPVKAPTVEPDISPTEPVDVTPGESTEVEAGKEQPSNPKCNSFSGGTGVLMANGSTKPIDQVKVGDEIENSVPGQSGTQDHAVTAVIVTKTDRDYVDLGIKPEESQASASISSGTPAEKAAPPARATGSAGTRTLNVATKLAIGAAATITAVVGLTSSAQHSSSAPSSVAAAAASAIHGGTLTTTYHHPFYDITQQSFIEAQYLHVGDELQTTTGRAEITSVRLYHADDVTYDLTIGELHTFYVLAGSTPVLVHNCGNGEVYDAGGSIRYHALDGEGRATGVSASINKSMLDTGTPADRSLDPSGWSGNGTLYNEARGHLLADRLGGSGDIYQNLVTLTQDPTNSPIMRDEIEGAIYDAVNQGQTVQYSVRAVYGSSGDVAPIGLQINAYGDQGFSLERYLENPAGMFPYEDGEP